MLTFSSTKGWSGAFYYGEGQLYHSACIMVGTIRAVLQWTDHQLSGKLVKKTTALRASFNVIAKQLSHMRISEYMNAFLFCYHQKVNNSTFLSCDFLLSTTSYKHQSFS